MVCSAERVRTTLSPAVLDIQGSIFPEKGGSKDAFKVRREWFFLCTCFGTE